MELRADAFADGTKIPKRFTGDGGDVSPALRWGAPPQGTRSFAMVLDDPDAPGRTWVHWILYGLPETERELAENLPPGPDLPSGARQGRNDFGGLGYGGPCPPRGSAHRYCFRLYALDVSLKLRAGATRVELDRAMRGHILAQAELTGRYRRAR
jgi:Raf kinase inhibitor-like YbhB/YbcL family protein